MSETKEDLKYIQLSNGLPLPRIGFGVFQLKYADCYDLVTAALDAGFRHIDTSEVFGNEDVCGKAVIDWCDRNRVPRTDIILSTKLANCSDYTATRASIRSSLHHLGTYIDIFSIFSPAAGSKARIESWGVMEEFIERGDIRCLGVCNYGIKHLEELYASKPKHLPVINQIELHPFLARDDIVNWCKEHNIVVEAYSPLTHGIRLQDPKLVEIANSIGIDVPRLLLRWSLQKGYVPIVQCTNPDQIRDNLDIFSLRIPKDIEDKITSLDEHWHADSSYDPTICE
ncbi:xylose and arabinose reductase [Schizosaccharomyces cryophilus OY26]|uniref:Xylose and arabinose reductase n=1 Tax=Schizosaccharomyces cryophilus (strain OY26 / ATCC MYA-4695 / CBS 11777 / NBRC 106824 / NRRL Y48691) TaxID=653667 RepID=S9VRT4_SCHCR|nr:xylose and arabinose reductase [Schizosaccharomyces cryophilus OY26]EPY50648.1 xylose and arabinose reductase [Schizosaccharomyces cryophilus OY26]